MSELPHSGNYPAVSPLHPHLLPTHQLPNLRTPPNLFPNFTNYPHLHSPNRLLLPPPHPPLSAPYLCKRKHLYNNNSNISMSREDDAFLKGFEKRVCKRQKRSSAVKVSSTLLRLGEVYQLLEEGKGSGSSTSHVLQIVEQSREVISSVCTPQNKRLLSKLVCERSKKKARKADAKERRSAKIGALVTEIDHWRATRLAEEVKRKQDEALQSEAGNTLQQVLQKQRHTKQLLETVKLLVELRDLRKEQAARRHGTRTEPDADNRFKKNVDLMKSVIKEKLETFYAEEKTIKVLTEANEADIWGVEKKLRKLEQLPSNVIDYSSVYLEIQYNPRSLIKIRHQWDEYIAVPGTLHASRVPTVDLGPPVAPSPEWALYVRPSQHK